MMEPTHLEYTHEKHGKAQQAKNSAAANTAGLPISPSVLILTTRPMIRWALDPPKREKRGSWTNLSFCYPPPADDGYDNFPLSLRFHEPNITGITAFLFQMLV